MNNVQDMRPAEDPVNKAVTKSDLKPMIGRAYSSELRSRVMDLVQQGHDNTSIAHHLKIAPRTVYRYIAAAKKQNTLIPKPKPSGGYRHSLLDRDQLIEIGKLLLQNPKQSMKRLKQLAVENGIINEKQVPSDTVFYSYIRNKLGLKYKKAKSKDPKTVHSDTTDDVSLNYLEQRFFRSMQRDGTEGSVNPNDLIFIDETNFRLVDDQKYAWAMSGSKQSLLIKPKGQSTTIACFCAIGVETEKKKKTETKASKLKERQDVKTNENDTNDDDQDEIKLFLYVLLVPPDKLYDPFPKRYRAYEFIDGVGKIGIKESNAETEHKLSFTSLKELLDEHKLKAPDKSESKDSQYNEMKQILIHAKTVGKVGLFRKLKSGSVFTGGQVKPHRTTANDFLTYLENLKSFYLSREAKAKPDASTCVGAGIEKCPQLGHHPSDAYVIPERVQKLNLERTVQKAYRSIDMLNHQILVINRKKNKTADDEKRMNEKKELIKEANATIVNSKGQFNTIEKGPAIDKSEPLSKRTIASKWKKKKIVLDNASTHLAIRVNTKDKISYLHKYANETLEIENCIYIPVLSPIFNPAELVFAFVKKYLRNQMPKEGWIPSGLIHSIREAFKRITPEMAKNWIKKCGYKFRAPKGDDDSSADEKSDEKKDEKKDEKLNACNLAKHATLPVKSQIICVDPLGSVYKTKARGESTWSYYVEPKQGTDLQDTVYLLKQELIEDKQSAVVVPDITEMKGMSRYIGIGPVPDLPVQKPESIERKDGSYEIDGIVMTRQNKKGETEYRVRWKGYQPVDDTWVSTDDIKDAKQALSEYRWRTSF
jgi:transposase